MRILIWLVCVLLFSLLPIGIHIVMQIAVGKPVLVASLVSSPDFALVAVVLAADGMGRVLNRLLKGSTSEESRSLVVAILLLFFVSVSGISYFVILRNGGESGPAPGSPMLFISSGILLFAAIGAVGAILLEEKGS